MVVLAASIVTRKGKALVSRQSVDMSRIKIEGYLAAFPKLVGIQKQHTYIETETVRYLYQPMEALYLLLITSKNSNILEDLKTLTLLSKLVSEYSASLDEEGISQRAFELIFAFDEVISLGHKENATVEQVKQYCEMYSEEETMHKFVLQNKINVTKDIMKQKASEIYKKKMNKIRVDNKSLPGSGGPESNFSTISGLGIDDPVSSRSKGSPPALATAPPKGLGMQLGKTQRTKQFLDLLRAEGEVILEDVPKFSQTTVALPLREPVTLTIEERLNVVTKRDGGVSTFDVRGTLSLQILNQEAAFIQIQIENNETPGFHFLTHPHINKELFNTEHIIGLKDPNRPFPTGQDDVGLLKWRIQDMDEASLPLAVNCWPFVSGNEAFVNIEYEASDKFDLSNVAISVPLPALKDPPSVRQIDGNWRYDEKKCKLEWAISLINDDNRSGSMEFVVPAADSLAFFPITIKFTATSTFSNVKVTGIIPLQGGSAPRFSQKIQLITDSYQVV